MATSSTSEHHCAVHLPRNAFSPRELARAADVWRGFQDVAVSGSIAGGWPPERYVQEGNAFVIRRMQVVHEREVTPNDTLRAKTWVQQVRRGMVSEREIRIYAQDALVASASQEWVHVDRNYKLAQAPQSLIDAFPTVRLDTPPAFPELDLIAGAKEHVFKLEVWQTWMDPLAHVNHPMYVDWCEEAVARTLVPLGLSPQDVIPHAEQLQYRAGAVAGDQIVMRTQLVGADGDRLAWKVKIARADETPCAEGTLIRSLRGGSGAWLSGVA